MRYEHYKITLIRRGQPEPNINAQLQWLGHSLGLFNLRDKDKSCFRVFITLLKSAKIGKGLTSDQLADLLHLSRGTVVHHLHKLQGAGIVVTRGNMYYMRVQDLKILIEEVERDVSHTLQNLKKIAENIDDTLK